ncbi:MAG: LysR substrate-binding domain-containing protein [Dongiaceae bacterium]
MENLPTLKQLRHLVALAEHRHFGKAAKASFVTQSTLSASLKELEAILGAALVDRTRRQVAFTPLGEETVQRAQRLLEDAEGLAGTARAMQAPLTGTVRLGVIPTIGPFLLPRILPALRRDYPKLKLYLREEQTEPLLEQLKAGRLDVLVLALPYDVGGAETAHLFDDPFAVAVRADNRLAKLSKIAPDRIEAETLLLLQDGHCLRDHALSACRLGSKPHWDAFEATSLHTLVQMVENGLGITLLPQLAIDGGILQGTDILLRPVSGTAPAREIALVWRRGTGRKAEFQLLAKEITRLAARDRGGAWPEPKAEGT